MKNKKTVILGLVGLPGSGKTTTADILKKNRFQNIILSSFIKKKLEKKNLTVDRKNLQDMGDKLRKQKGPAVLAKLALKQIKEKKITKAVIDGIRNLAEVDYLKKQPHFYLLGLSATPDKRFKRLLKNSDKYNNIKKWQDFIHYEIREDVGIKNKFGQQNRLCYLHADYFLTNNAGLKNLEKQINNILNQVF